MPPLIEDHPLVVPPSHSCFGKLHALLDCCCNTEEARTFANRECFHLRAAKSLTKETLVRKHTNVLILSKRSVLAILCIGGRFQGRRCSAASKYGDCNTELSEHDSRHHERDPVDISGKYSFKFTAVFERVVYAERLLPVISWSRKTGSPASYMERVLNSLPVR